MKVSKYLFLVLGIIYSVDFITLCFYNGSTHAFFIWQVNTWIYRGLKLGLAIIFMLAFFNRHKASLKG